ncbi:TPA: rhodanese-like domain-containing protein [Streptococcus suis]|uniref:Rhodanese-like domain-containing protein n=1 Tax=Streptococcus suivaginalis TaxID=3028082 RepID=A0AA97A1N3_9STRE|nr:rhodanese-like domain-containing protein [Streptococcus sp. 29896]MBM7314154.1 rhodanese-like domain-containing protein [Streptococcus suis]MCK4027449.1 rhodanese-like domain-containing protein [Streptococcus suis]WNY47960.1 rhodanese-like domain-containing protein [Streptococcus sp. 29896]HEL1586728.1 rhodanese-like domain-containing protein [Streptococcus suis]
MTVFSPELHSLPLESLTDVLENPQAVLLDVRDPDEFVRGHHPQAINCPLTSLDKFQADKSRTYYLICKTGKRSQQANIILLEQGYSAYSFSQGMEAWQGPISK